MSEIGNIYKQRTRDFIIYGTYVGIDLRLSKDYYSLEAGRLVQKCKTWKDHISIDFKNDAEYLRFLCWAKDADVQKHIESKGNWPKISFEEFNDKYMIDKKPQAGE